MGVVASIAVDDEDVDVVILLEVDTGGHKMYRTFELIFIPLYYEG